jgi:4-hydroxybenzoate polyprenyltransferase
MKKIRNYFRFLRPRQWIKNLAVFASLAFNQGLFDPQAFLHVFWGFLIFCGLSSATYIINDIVDINKDKLHPFKKLRPLPHGDITIYEAVVLFIILAGGSLFASLILQPSFTIITPPFFLICVTYIVLQLSYSFLLKQATVLDILAIASGYILRVYAGEILFPGSHIPAWLFLTTISLSLFLAVGKRRSELTLVSTQSSANIANIRSTLSHYSERLLDVYASIFATSTFLTYFLFTFVGTGQGLSVSNDLLLPDYLPQSLQKKWLMITILPVVYGLMRYLQDIYEKHEGESPERVLLSDKLLLSTVTIWVGMVIFIIYILQGS